MQESPFFLRFGKDPRIAAELKYETDCKDKSNAEAMGYVMNYQKRMIAAQNFLEATFERTDRLRAPHQQKLNNSFEMGDLVMVRNFAKTKKTEKEFISGYVVTEKVNEYTYMVKNDRTEKVTKIH